MEIYSDDLLCLYWGIRESKHYGEFINANIQAYVNGGPYNFHDYIEYEPLNRKIIDGIRAVIHKSVLEELPKIREIAMERIYIRARGEYNEFLEEKKRQAAAKIDCGWLVSKTMEVYPNISNFDFALRRHDIKAVSGIYFVINCDDGQLIYIGESQNMKSRLSSHHIYDRHKHFIGMAYPLIDRYERYDVETRLIRVFRPSMNVRQTINA